MPQAISRMTLRQFFRSSSLFWPGTLPNPSTAPSTWGANDDRQNIYTAPQRSSAWSTQWGKNAGQLTASRPKQSTNFWRARWSMPFQGDHPCLSYPRSQVFLDSHAKASASHSNLRLRAFIPMPTNMLLREWGSSKVLIIMISFKWGGRKCNASAWNNMKAMIVGGGAATLLGKSNERSTGGACMKAGKRARMEKIRKLRYAERSLGRVGDSTVTVTKFVGFFLVAGSIRGVRLEGLIHT